MKFLSDALEQITKWGAVLGGICLIYGMLLLVGNIIGRSFNFVIPGSIEMFELFMVLPVAFGLVYTALRKGHVVVHLITSRFPKRLGAVAEMFSSLLSIGIWALIAWASGNMALENGLKEFSETLELPYLPFRLIWTFCLFLFCLTYVVDFSRAFRRFVEK